MTDVWQNCHLTMGMDAPNVGNSNEGGINDR